MPTSGVSIAAPRGPHTPVLARLGGVSELGQSRVYLRPMADAWVPARHSSGARRRTAQLQRFLAALERSAREALGLEGAPHLLVANARDWRRLCSHPYGLPFTRTSRSHVSLVAAADYPSRLTRRFDDVLLRAGRAGVRAPADVREFLDLMVGHEWGHTVATRAGLRTRVRWLDELMASYLFAAALDAGGPSAARARLAAWVRVQVAGAAEERAPLDTFEYPRGRMRLGRLLWFRGVLTERALELARSREWGFARGLAERLPVADRGALARALVELEPGFRDWFATFGVGAQTGIGSPHPVSAPAAEPAPPEEASEDPAGEP